MLHLIKKRQRIQKIRSDLQQEQKALKFIMKTQKIFFLLDFLTSQLNKKKNSFLLHNKHLVKKAESTKRTKRTKATKTPLNSIISFTLYNNLNVAAQGLYFMSKIPHFNNENNIRASQPNFNKITTLTTLLSAENLNYRKVYQSLYLKQIPLQLTQLSITTTPQFKDNLTFSGEKAMEKTFLNNKQPALNTDLTSSINSNLFYNLFLKSYATSNEKTSSKSKERATKNNSGSDHIAYNLNTLDSIKNSNLNFSTILTPLSFFFKKKRQIVLVNKNISNKKIKKLYYNWYKIQLTRRYLNYINLKKKTNAKDRNKNKNFYLTLKNEHIKVNKLKFLKKSLTKNNKV